MKKLVIRIDLRQPIKIPKMGKRLAARAPPMGKEVLQIPVAVLLHFGGNHSVMPLLAAEGLILIPTPAKAANISKKVKLGTIEWRIRKNPTKIIPEIIPHFVPLRSTNLPPNTLKIEQVR